MAVGRQRSEAVRPMNRDALMVGEELRPDPKQLLDEAQVGSAE